MTDTEVHRFFRVLYTNARWAVSMATTMYHMHLVFDQGASMWTLVPHLMILARWHWRAVKEDLR